MNDIRTRVKTAAVVEALQLVFLTAGDDPALKRVIRAAMTEADEAHACAVEDSDEADRYQKYTEMTEVAKRYYTLLAEGESAAALVAEIRPKLDILLEPFSDDPAFTAFCQMKRAAAGLN